MLHNVNPDGDTLLILKNPVTDLALWEEEPEAAAWKVLYTRLGENVNEIEPQEDPDTYPQIDDMGQNGIIERNSDHHDDTATHLSQSETKSEDEDPTTEDTTSEIHYRVSSGQLNLTSRYFRNMFKGQYQEATPDANDGLYHIEAFGWDPDALLTILYIVHARSNLVPRDIDLNMLAKLAKIVDYYELHDAVSRDSDIWIQKLKKTPLPTRYCQEAVIWMFVSWVFGEGKVFEQMTRFAMNQSRCPVQTLELPIPPHIIDAIDEKRQSSIKAVIQGLQDLVAELRDGKKGCSFGCGAMLLGSLMKTLHSNNLLADLSRYPQPPFRGLSFKDTVVNVRLIRSPLWNECQNNSHRSNRRSSNRFGRYTSSPDACTLEIFVQPIIDITDTTMTGLKLTDFRKSG